MQVLKRGHTELFRRGPDECFDSLAALNSFCQEQKAKSVDRWLPPHTSMPAYWRSTVWWSISPTPPPSNRTAAYHLNDWSFTQLCQLAKVSRDTVNRVTADTAWASFGDTLPDGNKPLQLYTDGENIRSIHGVSYTRLYNADKLAMLAEFATDPRPCPAFAPPSVATYWAAAPVSMPENRTCSSFSSTRPVGPTSAGRALPPVSSCGTARWANVRSAFRLSGSRLSARAVIDDDHSESAAPSKSREAETAVDRPIRQPRHFVLKRCESWFNECGWPMAQ